jgi:tRNA-guanine family transglycosylase
MSYSFVPAAIDSFDARGMTLYVKYTKSKSNNVFIKEDNPRYTWFICPDRELLIVKNTAQEYHPAGENFDEAINLDVYDDRVLQELGTDIYMLNSGAFGDNPERSPRLRRNGRNPKLVQPHILADSGGFQILSGRTDYIDPIKVVEWYNENTDWGMVLDVPPIVSDWDNVKRGARIQAKNTEIMFKHKTKELELVNVIQGFDSKQRAAFLDMVDHPEINRLAIAGSYRIENLVERITDILKIIHLDRKFKHYHILGIYSLTTLLPLIQISNLSTVNALITSDASTPLQSAVNKFYHHQQSIFSPERRLPIGHKDIVYNSRLYLPCHCPVCSAVKYQNIFSFVDTGVITALLTLHNLYEINRYTSMMNELSQTISYKEYRSITRHQLGGRAPATLQALDLIHEYSKDPDKAFKIYSAINTGSMLFKPSPLYKDISDTPIALLVKGNGGIERKEETAEEMVERQKRVLHNYESRYKIKPKDNTKKKKKKKKSKVKG